jgi:hypothetical protein
MVGTKIVVIDAPVERRSGVLWHVEEAKSSGRFTSEAVSFHSCINASRQLHPSAAIHVVRRRDRARGNPAPCAAMFSFSYQFNCDHDAYFQTIGDGAKEENSVKR